MARIRSFPPLGHRRAHTLVLGTMPGTASLRAGEYYAHPRNAFWSIVGDVFGFDAALDYESRVQLLAKADIAVWDVLQSCERAGSLDARIDGSSVVANDFARFFAEHRRIERVCFNGGTADALFRRHALPSLDGLTAALVRLPSTSPANASITPAAKLRAWRAALTSTALHNTASPEVT
jgi:double-stranded uracil-DNA glycosylase